MKRVLCIMLLSSLMIGEGKISGTGFFNYTSDLTDGVSGSDKSSFGFDRVYFTYKNSVSDNISFKFQTDVGRFDFVDEDDDGNAIVGGKSHLFAYIKKAQLDWKTPISKITLGMQGMNVFNVTEKTWGFRFIEKSPMDKHKFSSSADMGIGVSGKFSNVSYSLLSTNGAGYKKEESDAFKKTSIQLVYGEKKLVKKDGFNIGTSLTFEPYHDGEDYMKSVMAFFGGYAGSGFRVGAEFDTKTDSKTELSEQIIAFYGSYKFTDVFEGLVYIDMYDEDTAADEDGETYIIAGLNYYPTKGLTITPNVRLKSFEDESDGETVFKMNFQFKF
jgi:hypothetical protein